MNKFPAPPPMPELPPMPLQHQREAAFPAPPPMPVDPTPAPIPEPTQSEVIVKTIISIGLPVVYVAFLAFLTIEWLVFNHPDLKEICIGGFGALAGVALNEIGHYTGQQNTIGAVNAGVGLEPMQRGQRS